MYPISLLNYKSLTSLAPYIFKFSYSAHLFKSNDIFFVWLIHKSGKEITAVYLKDVIYVKLEFYLV